jgi:Na+-driven multidrug efflux pump
MITLPLTIYALFNYFYGFIDFLLVSQIGTDDIGAVFFIGDITGVPLGQSSAVGAALGLLTTHQALELAAYAEAAR